MALLVMFFLIFIFFFFNDTATTEIYTSIDTLSLHDALPISSARCRSRPPADRSVRSIPETAHRRRTPRLALRTRHYRGNGRARDERGTRVLQPAARRRGTGPGRARAGARRACRRRRPAPGRDRTTRGPPDGDRPGPRSRP